MKLNDIRKILFGAWEAQVTDTTFLVLGPPGVGKSSMAAQVAEDMTAYVQRQNPSAAAAVCEVVDLSSKNPEEISGLPYRRTVGGREETAYAPLSWLSRLANEKTYGVLLLDDLPAATPAVQVATRQLVLDRRVGDAHLSKFVLPVVTGNRREDKSSASTLPAHFRNAVCILEAEPDFGYDPNSARATGWLEWYSNQPGLHPMIPAFLCFKPGSFSTLPKDADTRGAFATPRSWTKLGRLYDVAAKSKNLMEVASGLVGEGHATEFVAFVNVRASLVDPGLVLQDPQKYLPDPRVLNSPDRQVAMVTGLAEAASEALKKGGKKAEKVPADFVRAIAWVSPGAREYVGLGISTYLRLMGPNSMGGLHKGIISIRAEPGVKELVAFLEKALAA